MRHRIPALVISAALIIPTALATGGVALAQDDGQFCKGTNIVFFPGGTEGGGFETVVYNGAKAAEKALGPTVAYQWSDWLPENMITQFQQAVATNPDGIAVMGHPGDDAFDPLIDDAVSKGIIVTVMNTELQKAEAAHGPAGTGYVGAVLYDAGKALGNETIKRAGLQKGDKVFLWGLESQAGRGQRTQGIHDALNDAGMNVIYLEIDNATNADPSAGISTFTGMASANPDLKAAIFDHGNVTSAAQSYLEAAGIKPEALYVSGFDLSPATVSAVQTGYVDLVIDQQQWLQGFMGVLQICLAHNYGFSGLFVNTGGGFVDASNIDVIAPLVAQQIR